MTRIGETNPGVCTYETRDTGNACSVSIVLILSMTELNITSTAGQDVKIPDTAGCIWMATRYVEITSSMFQYWSHFRLSSCKQGD